MKLVGVSFGHNDKFNVGAVGIYSEDLLNREVGQAIINKINNDGVCRAVRLFKENVVSEEDSICYRPNMANSLGCDVAIDVHHNSFGQETANGCECLGTGEASERLCNCILNRITKLGYNNRGFKYNTYAFNSISVMPSCIIEPFFITNQSDCDKYNKEVEAAAIVNGIYDFLNLDMATAPDVPNVESNKSRYVVVGGDTLWDIAMALNVSVDHLVNQNAITNASLIYPGQILYYVPGSNNSSENNLGGQYVVESGDCLSVIAENLGVDMDRLISLNAISDPNFIYEGQILKY